METKIKISLASLIIKGAEKATLVIYSKSHRIVFNCDINSTEGKSIELEEMATIDLDSVGKFNVWVFNDGGWSISFTGVARTAVDNFGSTFLEVSDKEKTKQEIHKVIGIKKADIDFVAEILGVDNSVVPTPSISQMAKSLTSSVTGWAKAGFATASAEDLDARLAICNGCEFWEESGFAGTGKCKQCGCSTQAKLRMATSKCPIDKWGPVDVVKTD